MLRAKIRDPGASANAMYRSLGQGLVELLWLAGAPVARREDFISRVSVDEDTIAALDAACARGPVVLFASHTGNWELTAARAARLLAARGKRLAVVAKAMRARGVHAFLDRLRERLGIHVVSPRGALASSKRILDAGDVVVLPIDQVPERSSHGMACPFLGGSAVTDRSPATLAWRVGATVLVVATERIADRHCVRVLDVMVPPTRGVSARAWIEAATRRATSQLEAFVRQSPASWMWLHQRWRAPHDRGRVHDDVTIVGLGDRRRGHVPW